MEDPKTVIEFYNSYDEDNINLWRRTVDGYSSFIGYTW